MEAFLAHRSSLQHRQLKAMNLLLLRTRFAAIALVTDNAVREARSSESRDGATAVGCPACRMMILMHTSFSLL